MSAITGWRLSSGHQRILQLGHCHFEPTKALKKGLMPVPARVSATDRVRAKIDELFASDRELSEILKEWRDWVRGR
ncbi:hypothetical protein H7J50_16370 [Mycobacterium intermedium]|uniref:Uncharacterized protein n=2 Tax=Mycobacterium TaxID=1763 RepID=A0A7I9YTZ9_MYCBU|nr:MULTISPECIES: hypothetical protein [Mycobacterium]MCV6965364.1 hypothetical protein [Mycobacterium intermedium]MCV6977250.1 hypothetical protein [Mycobacterium bourgelatii]GFG92161.1 hypothetical protein MBOU_42030 [Mycobacterium bourgelatii]